MLCSHNTYLPKLADNPNRVLPGKISNKHTFSKTASEKKEYVK